MFLFLESELNKETVLV